jgi:hypothetical protein
MASVISCPVNRRLNQRGVVEGPVEISCQEVIRELSNYIDNDLSAGLREQITEHLPSCLHCTAVYDGMRNMITLMGDRRVFELPSGFSQRLRERLAWK